MFSCRITKDIPLDEVAILYREAGWITDDADTSFIVPMIGNSFCVCAAFNESGELAGMMRALSDGVSDAYILDLVVAGRFRRKGIGKQILDTLVGHLKSLGIDWIVLIGAPDTESFYEKSDASIMKGYTPMRFEF